jgi:hypothetical protein
MLQVGRGLVGHRAEVTVSVSSHVPKPHTPLQWCAQDTEPEIRRKQAILRHTAAPRGGRRDHGLRLKHHHSGISFIEGVLARGDRRLADVIEAAWRAGARFDGWDEVFDLDRWTAALEAHGVDVAAYLGTRPVTARLPWDHIDVGLEDGFLLGEYRKALKGRASPPCGKVAGMLIHHTNLTDAEPDRRKLVCYDCGVACDLSKMREDRLVALRALDARERPAPRGAPAVGDAAALVDVSERGGGSPAELSEAAQDSADPQTAPARGNPREGPASPDRGGREPPLSAIETERAERVRLAGHHGAGAPYATYRIRFAKVGRAAFLGHLDLVRLLARSFRRADLPLAVTRGFSPKPRISFGPALGLGVPSLGELMDVDLEHVAPGRRSWDSGDAARLELPAGEVADRLAAVCPPGIEIQSCAVVRLAGHPAAVPAAPDLGLGKLIDAVDLAIQPVPDGMAHDAARLERLAGALLARSQAWVARGDKQIDVRAMVIAADPIAGDAARALCAALDWPDRAVLRVRIRATADGSAKPSEVAKALGVWGADDPRAEHALIARLGVVVRGGPVAAAAAAPSPASAVAPA